MFLNTVLPTMFPLYVLSSIIASSGFLTYICKPLKPESYFATYNDAYAALVEYNKNPYDLGTAITMQELYDKWLPEYEKTVKSTKAVTSAWPYCSAVYKMRVMDIRARHVKAAWKRAWPLFEAESSIQQPP